MSNPYAIKRSATDHSFYRFRRRFLRAAWDRYNLILSELSIRNAEMREIFGTRWPQGDEERAALDAEMARLFEDLRRARIAFDSALEKLILYQTTNVRDDADRAPKKARR